MDFLSSVSQSSKFMEPKERGLWEPLIYSQWIRSTGDILGLQLASEVEGSLVRLSPSYVNLMLSLSRGYQS